MVHKVQKSVHIVIECFPMTHTKNYFIDVFWYIFKKFDHSVPVIGAAATLLRISFFSQNKDESREPIEIETVLCRLCRFYFYAVSYCNVLFLCENYHCLPFIFPFFSVQNQV